MTRSLAREWYLKKALVRKIGVGMGEVEMVRVGALADGDVGEGSGDGGESHEDEGDDG